MAVGFPAKTNFATGDVLTATNMNDVTGTLNLLQSTLYPAGRNKIINGDFSINQYGLNSTGVAYSTSHVIDRWVAAASGATGTASLQAFTLGAAPVAGYESTSFFRMATTVGNDFCRAIQRIESVRTFANETVVLSFWAKGTNPATLGRLNVRLQQYFGAGGSPSASVETAEQNLVLTANWTRYTYTFTVPSIAGKTLGTTGDYLAVDIGQLVNASTDAWTLDLWGVQLEAASTGSTASPFQTASGSKGGELALCQRYYYRNAPGVANAIIGFGMASSTTSTRIQFSPKMTMRTKPSAVEFAGNYLTDGVTAFTTLSSITLSDAGPNSLAVVVNVASGLTQFRPYEFVSLNTTDYIAWSAERCAGVSTNGLTCFSNCSLNLNNPL